MSGRSSKHGCYQRCRSTLWQQQGAASLPHRTLLARNVCAWSLSSRSGRCPARVYCRSTLLWHAASGSRRAAYLRIPTAPASQGTCARGRSQCQPQYTAEQLSVGIRLEIRCPLDMSRGQRIPSRIPTAMLLYSTHNYHRYSIEEERRLKGGVACALGVTSPPNEFDNGGRRVTPYSPYSLETVYMHTFIPAVYGKFP